MPEATRSGFSAGALRAFSARPTLEPRGARTRPTSCRGPCRCVGERGATRQGVASRMRGRQLLGPLASAVSSGSFVARGPVWSGGRGGIVAATSSPTAKASPSPKALPCSYCVVPSQAAQAPPNPPAMSARRRGRHPMHRAYCTRRRLAQADKAAGAPSVRRHGAMRGRQFARGRPVVGVGGVIHRWRRLAAGVDRLLAGILNDREGCVSPQSSDHGP